MGIVNRISGYKNLVMKFIGQDFWGMFRKPPRHLQERLARAEIRFVLAQVDDAALAEIPARVSRLLSLGSDFQGSIEYVFSSLVFLTFPEDAGKGVTARFVRAVGERLPFPCRVVHGVLPALRGLYGSPGRVQFGSIVSDLKGPLGRLLALDLGRQEQWPAAAAPLTGEGIPETFPSAPAGGATRPPSRGRALRPGKPRPAPPAPVPGPRTGQALPEAGSAPSDAGKLWYIVWDTIGDGKLVGVFESREVADRLFQVNPWYYKVFPCPPNLVLRSTYEWLDGNQRRAVSEIAPLTDR